MNAREGFLAGALTFVGLSWVCHCKFKMGPWQCQKKGCRHNGAVGCGRKKTKRRKKRKLVP